MSENNETPPRSGYERATHTFESDRSQKASAAGVASIPVVTSSTPPPLPAPSSGAKAASDS
jgi:hypothetical protein